MWRAPTALGLALLLATLTTTAAAVPVCSDLDIKQSKAPSKRAPGRRLRLSYTVRNTGSTRDVALGVIVPPGAILQKMSPAAAHNSKHATPVDASNIDAKLQRVFGAYWPSDTLRSKKSRKFTATFLVAKCSPMPDNLLFQARVMSTHNYTVTCAKDFAQQKVRVGI